MSHTYVSLQLITVIHSYLYSPFFCNCLFIELGAS